MKTVKGMPITGAKRHFSKKRPFVPNAKDTSGDVQSMIQEPPTPFKNRMTSAQMPTGAQSQNGPTAQPTAGKAGSRAPLHPAMEAAGQRKMPNQSGQVFGRMGTKHPKRKRSPFFGE